MNETEKKTDYVVKPKRSSCCDMPLAFCMDVDVNPEAVRLLEKCVFCTGCFLRYFRILTKNPDWVEGEKEQKKWRKSYRRLNDDEISLISEYEITK